MNLCSISSGSSGNCVYVSSEKSRFLIDVGISGKRIENGLASISVDPQTLDGIFVTHEHLDHISGLGVMARRYGLPIYATAETICEINRTKSVGRIKEELYHIIEPDETIVIKDMEIHPFSISHDAGNPVGYTLQSDGHKVGIATDLGKYDDYIVSKLFGSEILLLEANHDINMLQVGAYPYVLKRRILGERGHLSNDNSGKLICELLNERLKHIFLGHLSKDNNYPDLAYETVKYQLEQSNSPFKRQVVVRVANREEPSPLVSV